MSANSTFKLPEAFTYLGAVNNGSRLKAAASNKAPTLAVVQQRTDASTVGAHNLFIKKL